MAAAAPLRIGFSGFGSSGPHEARVFESIPGCAVAGVYDPKPGGRERAKRAYPGVLVTDDLDALLGSGLDVLAVCSPMHVHAEQIVRALDAGLHVICEPPLAAKREDCERILRAADAHPELTVSVQRIMRHLPLHLAMREAVASGELGRVTYASATSAQDVRRRMGLNDTWAFDDPPPAMLYAGFQVLDALQWILGDEVVAATGASARAAFPEFREDDVAAAVLRFRSGLVGGIVTLLSANRPQDTSIRILGDRRSIEDNLVLAADGTRRRLARPIFRQRRGASGLRKRAGALWRDLRWNLGPVVADRLVSAAERLCLRGSGYTVGAYPFRLHEHGVALGASVRAFVEDVRAGRAPREALRESARVVAVALACAEACRSGETVTVCETAPVGTLVEPKGERVAGPERT